MESTHVLRRNAYTVTAMWCVLLPLLMFAARSEAASDGSFYDPVVARRMGAYYEVFVGRRVTVDERRQVTIEFVRGHSRSGKTQEAIRELARTFVMSMIVLREDKDGAAALYLRHRLLDTNYFRPEMQNTLELRLLTEPDPVRVVDERAKRLMTERDIVALANIRHFARSQDAPLHKELSRRQVDRLVAVLNDDVANRLPQFFGDAATFWAGVRQLWPYLTVQQQSLVRAYANNTWRTSMPVEMYAALWGLDRSSASRRWSDDVAARIRGRADTGLGNLHAAMDAMFGG